MEERKGRLVITSVPTKRAGEQMVEYLQTLMKNATPDQIKKKVETLPATLANNIGEKNGKKIVADLIKMGVIANFIDPNAKEEPADTTYVEVYEGIEHGDSIVQTWVSLYKEYEVTDQVLNYFRTKSRQVLDFFNKKFGKKSM